jgi:hypothetical protein
MDVLRISDPDIRHLISGMGKNSQIIEMCCERYIGMDCKNTVLTIEYSRNTDGRRNYFFVNKP